MQQGEEKATRGEGKHRRRQTGDDRRHKEIRQKKKTEEETKARRGDARQGDEAGHKKMR